MSAGWLPAKMLQAGMTLVNRDNEQTLKVVSQTKLNKTDTVYNFEVDEFHTYHIGEFGVWVHNACYDSWRITQHTVTVKHHNWNKIFGNKTVTLDDVNPIIKQALSKGEWVDTGDIYRGAKGVKVGNKLKLTAEVDGHTIWVEGIRFLDGTVSPKNAGVK